MDDGIPLPSSDSAMIPKKKKNCRATFKTLKAKDDALLNIRPKRPAFVLKPLKSMLNPVIDRISLQQLEYEMERVDIPDDSNVFEIG